MRSAIARWRAGTRTTLRIGPVLAVAAVAGYLLGGCSGDDSTGLPGLSGVTELPTGSLPSLTLTTRTEASPTTTAEAPTTTLEPETVTQPATTVIPTETAAPTPTAPATTSTGPTDTAEGEPADRRVLGLDRTRARRCPRGDDDDTRDPDHDERRHESDGNGCGRACVLREQYALGVDRPRPSACTRGGGRGRRDLATATRECQLVTL